MTGFAKLKIVRPTCFGDRHIFHRSAPECLACHTVESCDSSIGNDVLLADLLCEDGGDAGALAPTKAICGQRSGASFNVPQTGDAATSPIDDGIHETTHMLYAFPVPTGRRYEQFSNAELIDELVVLIRKGRVASLAIHYSAVRAEMCAVHIEMNLRQQHAPRFRPRPPLQKKPDAGDETHLARDRQVIDIHWRAHSSEKPLAPVHDYPGIFENAPFDFEIASRFAQLEWKSQTKVIHLHLTEDMQWEQALLQHPSIRDKWRTIENGDVRGHQVKQAGAPHVESLLRDAMSNAPHLKTHIPGLVLTWKAGRIIGDKPKRITKLVALMTGEKPRDVSAIRRTLTSLDGYLKAAPKVTKN